MTNPWVILGVVLAVIAAFSGGYYKGDEAGQAYVQQQWDKERADTLVKYTEEVEKAREKSRIGNKLRTTSGRKKTVNSRIFMLVIPLWLTACATARPAPMMVPCPVRPVLDKVDVPEKSFTERMEHFLSGSLEKQTNSDQPSSNATNNTNR